jgi:hypothetical protein
MELLFAPYPAERDKQKQDFFRPGRANQVGNRGILGKSKDQIET